MSLLRWSDNEDPVVAVVLPGPREVSARGPHLGIDSLFSAGVLESTPPSSANCCVVFYIPTGVLSQDILFEEMMGYPDSIDILRLSFLGENSSDPFLDRKMGYI